jgi:glycosyltransferase involved in cell wall biosynthesis
MTSIAAEDGLRIAVLLPCYNEALTVGGVVRGFAQVLPGARIFVFDNNSTDDTPCAAARAGAQVFREVRQGKGNVVRRMFADIDADIYIMADGDGTYDPADAPSLVNALITERVDMVVGARQRRRTGRGPLRPRFRQPHLQPALWLAVRPRLQRHLFGLPRLYPALREKLSGDLRRL